MLEKFKRISLYGRDLEKLSEPWTVLHSNGVDRRDLVDNWRNERVGVERVGRVATGTRQRRQRDASSRVVGLMQNAPNMV